MGTEDQPLNTAAIRAEFYPSLMAGKGYASVVLQLCDALDDARAERDALLARALTGK